MLNLTNEQKIDNHFKYNICFYFFEKKYTSIFLDLSINNFLNKDELLDDFIKYLINSFYIVNNILFSNYIISNYDKNKFIKKIVNVYIKFNINHILIFYLKNLTYTFIKDNNINKYSYKLYILYLKNDFDKNKIEYHTNIKININDSFIDFLNNKNDNFYDDLFQYFLLKTKNYKFLFDIFINNSEFENYIKNLYILTNDVIKPNFNNSI